MPKNILTKHIPMLRPGNLATTMSYEDIFKGTAVMHAAALGRLSFPSSHRLGDQDPEAYFKDVFAGAVL